MFAFSVFQVKPQLCTGSQMHSPERNLPLLLCAFWGWRRGVHVKLKLPLLWSLHRSPSECSALCWEFWAETQWEPGPSSLMPTQFYQPHYSDTEIHQDQLHLLLFWVMILFLQTALSRPPPQPLHFLSQLSKYRPLEAPQNFPPPFALVSHSCMTFSDGLPALETGSVLCSLPVVPLLTRGLPLGLLLFPCISPVEIGASQGPSPSPFPQ